MEYEILINFDGFLIIVSLYIFESGFIIDSNLKY